MTTKKNWKQPVLEVLDVNMTMAGPGHGAPDSIQRDDDDVISFDPTLPRVPGSS